MIDFLAANWLWIVLIAAFVALHRRGGGCGSHGSHGGHGHGNHDQRERPAGADREQHAGHR